MTTKAPPKRPPWRSGYCGHNLPAWSHDRCARAHDGNPCICPCHTPPEEEPMSTSKPTPEEDVSAGHTGEQVEVRTLDGTVVHFPTAHDLPTAVNGLACAAEALSANAMAKDVAGVDWQDAIRLLDRLRAASDLIGATQAALIQHVYLTGEHGDQVVEGVGVVKIARGRDRKSWEVPSLVRAVVDAKMEEREGETPDPWDVVEWLLEVAHVDYARVTPLRAMGLDPREFCAESPGRPNVTLPPR